MWKSYSNLPKAIFYLFKEDYTLGIPGFRDMTPKTGEPHGKYMEDKMETRIV